MKLTHIAPLLAILIIATALVPLGTAHVISDQTTILVDENGDARIIIAESYNFSDDAEKQKFEELSTNETAQEEYKTDILDEYKSYAEQQSNQDPADVGNVKLQTRKEGDTDSGVAQIELQWKNFAEVTEDNEVVVHKPLPEDFSPDHPTILAGPREYEIKTTENIGDGQTQENKAVIWGSNPSMENLNVVFEPVEQSTQQPPKTQEPTQTQEQPTETFGTEDTDDNSGFSLSQLLGFGGAIAVFTVAGGFLYRRLYSAD